MMRLAATLCAALILLTGAAFAAPAMPTAAAVATPAASLVGKIWQADGRRFASFDELLQAARTADIVLLGETHDSPEHHALQLKVLAGLATAMPPPVLVMEQFDLGQQARLDAIMNATDTPQQKLDALQALMDPGWDWAGYQPLLATAVQYRLRIVAANIAREALRDIGRKGLAALGAGETARLGLEQGWRPAQQAQLASDVAESHCGALPPAAVIAIALSQRVRDAIMADRLLTAGPATVVAILGRGHVRRDLAVPLYLAARAPQRSVLAIGLSEIGTSGIPSDYAEGTLGRLYDYVFFANAVVRKEDPCAQFKLPAAAMPR